MTNILHSSKSDSWMTPPEIVEKVQKVLGGIDLDPASSWKANKTVRANLFFDKEYDALRGGDWTNLPVSVFLNPPGGKIGNKSKTLLFWEKLIEQYEKGKVKHAIFLAFGINALQVCQNTETPITDFYICIPRRRLSFVSTSEQIGNPTHANAIVYLPGLKQKTSTFYDHFHEIGAILQPVKLKRFL